jgi:integrase
MRTDYAAGRPVVVPGSREPAARTIDTLIDAYLVHCDGYYANSKPTIHNIERALLPLHERFGRRSMDSLGPRLLRELREDLVRDGYTRKVINARIQTIVRMFKWAVAEELVPAATHDALRAVEGLRMGRTAAPEGPGRRPVPWEHVEPVLAHVAREVAAMLVIQAESGARPGEIVQMRAGDLDRSGKVWTYKPRRHKTQHLGKTRLVPLFEPAQEALLPFLQRVPQLDPEDFVFSPQRAEASKSKTRRRNRKTRVQPSQLAREARALEERARPPRDGYDVNTYARAVRRGIDAANAAMLRAVLVTALLPLYAEPDRVRAERAFTALPIQFLRILRSTDPQVLEVEQRRLRRIVRRGLKGGEASDQALDQLVAAGNAALEKAKGKLVPYWSPYQLRHRFATVGEERFGEAAAVAGMARTQAAGRSGETPTQRASSTSTRKRAPRASLRTKAPCMPRHSASGSSRARASRNWLSPPVSTGLASSVPPNCCPSPNRNSSPTRSASRRSSGASTRSTAWVPTWCSSTHRRRLGRSRSGRS